MEHNVNQVNRFQIKERMGLPKCWNCYLSTWSRLLYEISLGTKLKCPNVILIFEYQFSSTTRGFLIGFVLLLRPQFGWRERHQLHEHLRVKSKFSPYQLVLFVIALAVLIAGYTVGMIMLFKGKRGIDYCKWCQYLNCVPSSRWKCD